MKYDTLLFDIDNTLLDFTADENQALDRLFALTPIKLTSRIKNNTFNTIKIYGINLKRKI